MVRKRAFSLYDIEQFLKDAGAEKTDERAVRSFGNELENTVKVLVEDAALYANYAGRRRVIKRSDIELASIGKPTKRSYIGLRRTIRGARALRKRAPIASLSHGRIIIKAASPFPS